MKKLIGLILSIFLCHNLYAAEIVRVEYFLDHDPGYENGVDIPITSGSEITADFIVDVSEVELGHHMLYIRAKDSDGNWSLEHARPIFKVARIDSEALPDIVEMEYFIDIDPGYGNGTDIPFEAGAEVTADFFVDLSGVELGHHILYIRAQNARGEWSLTHDRPFFKTKMTEADGYNIVNLEYFIDTDPGYGNGVNIPVAPGRDVTADITIDLTGLSLGTHTLFIRAQDEHGEWSVAREEEIEVVNDFTLASAIPTTVINAGNATINLTGPILSRYFDVKLIGPGGAQMYATGTFRMSDTELSASFDMNDAQPGLYSVVVYDGGRQSVLADAVLVTADGTEGHLRVTATPPEFVRPARKYTCWIEYENDGNTDLPAPLFVVSNSAGAPMRLSKNEPFRDGPVQVLGVNLNGPAGWLPPGSVNRIPVYFQVPNGARDDIEFTVEKMVADEQPVDWYAIESEIRPDDMDEDAWDVIWSSFREQMGDTWAEYLAALNRDATYISLNRESKETVLAGMEMDIKKSLDIHVYSVRTLLGFEMLKASAGLSPRSVLAASQDMYLPASGFPLAFGRFAPQSIEGRFAVGPFGRGWAHTYQYEAEEQDNGNVYINGPGGTARSFFKLSDGSFQGKAGDYAELSRDGTDFVLREKGGMTWRFASTGQLSAIRDLNGNQLAFSHLSDGLYQIAHSNGDIITITYAGNGRIAEVSDSSGRTVLYRYDASGDYLVEVEEPGGIITEYAYHADDGTPSAHALEQISLSDAPSYNYAFDAWGRLQEEWIDGNLAQVRYTYSDTGTVAVTDISGNTSTIWFGPNGKVIKMKDSQGNIVKNAFNGIFKSPQTTNPDGNSLAISYDMNGNPVGVKNPLGNITKMDYNLEFNRLRSLTDAHLNSITFGYDDRGNLESITYPDRTTEYFETDMAGNVTAYTNRRLQTIDFQYNHRGQVTKKTYPDGRTITYQYNTQGLLASAADSQTGSISMKYDSRNKLSRIEYPGGYWFEFEYNDAGQRTRRLDHDGFELNYLYDEGGRLKEIIDGEGNLITRYEYKNKKRSLHPSDQINQVIREERGNGTFTAKVYSDTGMLDNIVNYSNDGEIQSLFAYTHDEYNNVTSIKTTDGKTSYDRDPNGRVSGITHPDESKEFIEYDNVGNRIRKTDENQTIFYTINDMNQYLQVGDVSFSYDKDGNLILESNEDGVAKYTYDLESRLTRMEAPDGKVYEYAYDALGFRVSKKQNGDFTHYIYDPIGMHINAEYEDNNLKAKYVHGNNGLISKTDGDGVTNYYLGDGSGNVCQITDQNGNILNSYTYGYDGDILNSFETIPNSNHRYGGKVRAITEGSLTLSRGEVYSVQSGKFVKENPALSGNNNFDFQNALKGMGFGMISGIPAGFINGAWDRIAEGIIKGERSKSDLALNFFIGGFVGLSTAPAKEGLKGILSGGTGVPVDEAIKIPIGIPVVSSIADDVWHYINFLIYISSNGRDFEKINYNINLVFEIDPNFYYNNTRLIKSKSIVIARGGSQIVIPIDPNEKTATPGIGTQHYIISGQGLSYTVYFENKPSATAPAQEVFITDTLDADLDWNTFKLGEIAFGDAVFSTMKGNTDFTDRVAYKDMAVDFIVEQNPDTGEVKWTLRTIDPDTGELPEDVFAGFLPPEDGNGSGQGYVTFTVNAQDDLNAGTRITNKASIVFDTNAPIITNEVFNTITHDTPAASSEPYTADGATDVAINTVLSWAPSDYATTYDLYLWKSNDPQPTKPTATGLSTPFYEPVGLEYETTYQWAVVSRNLMGGAQSPVWTFTTAAGPSPLQDVIMLLQVLTGVERNVGHITDVDGDGKKGLVEAIYLLRVASGH